MRWLGGVQTRRELKSDVAYFIKAEAREGFTFWVVELAADQSFLGFCGLMRISEADCPVNGEVEIGWRIREDVWRRGYAFEAAQAVLDYAFAQRGNQFVVSRTAVGNAASRGLMRKLGMRHDPALDYIPEGEEDLLITCVITNVVRQDPFSGDCQRARFRVERYSCVEPCAYKVGVRFAPRADAHGSGWTPRMQTSGDGRAHRA